jgi:predicted  nucleic acid-binding Zn-ribbon protein
VKDPVFDMEGRVRSKHEPTINKSLVTRDKKGDLIDIKTLESTDLNKIQNDYKRLENKFDAMMSKIDILTTIVLKQTDDIAVLKEENKSLRETVSTQTKEIARLNNVVYSQSNEIQRLNGVVSNLNNVVSNQSQEITKLNGVISSQGQEIQGQRYEIQRLNGVVSNQGQEIQSLNQRIEKLEITNSNLVKENQSLKNAQAPVLRISSVPSKRRKREEIYESDEDKSINESDLESVPLSPRDAMGRKWNPITGMRDTFSIFTPRSVLLQEKQENSLRRAAFSNELPKIKRFLYDNPSIVNGRGMPDSLCSLVKSFYDKTPLMLAAQEGNFECVKTLVEAGAALDLLDRDNFTALDYAQQNQHREVSSFLMRQKAHNGVDIVEKEDVTGKMKLN